MQTPEMTITEPAPATEEAAIESRLRDVQAEVESLRSFTVPAPAQLPIDSLSFDGAAQVFKHTPKDDQDS